MEYPWNTAGSGAAGRDAASPATGHGSGAQVSAKALLDLAVSVVRPAGALAQALRARGVEGVTTKSTETDVVTAADRAVERQVVQALRAARPGDAFLGEEYGEEHGGPGAETGRQGPAVRWILDPIDGTVNYLYGLPWYAVSLAVEVAGEVVAGVVYNPATGRLWTATRGGGAYAGDRRLTGSSQTRLAQSLVATGFGYDPARRTHQARVLAALLHQIRDIRRFGAASLDLCLAAEGGCDAYFEQGLQPWDHAAGGLIASEAGLTVTGLRGVPAGPRLLLAAPPVLHGPLHDRLVELDADGGP